MRNQLSKASGAILFVTTLVLLTHLGVASAGPPQKVCDKKLSDMNAALDPTDLNCTKACKNAKWLVKQCAAYTEVPADYIEACGENTCGVHCPDEGEAIFRSCRRHRPRRGSLFP